MKSVLRLLHSELKKLNRLILLLMSSDSIVVHESIWMLCNLVKVDKSSSEHWPEPIQSSSRFTLFDKSNERKCQAFNRLRLTRGDISRIPSDVGDPICKNVREALFVKSGACT